MLQIINRKQKNVIYLTYLIIGCGFLHIVNTLKENMMSQYRNKSKEKYSKDNGQKYCVCEWQKNNKRKKRRISKIKQKRKQEGEYYKKYFLIANKFNVISERIIDGHYA
ncbi:hypothetical protein ABPG72_015762 [Tetrahymena utriculariae]